MKQCNKNRQGKKEIRQNEEIKLKTREMMLIFVATLGFWGLFYPNFGMTDDVCRVYHIEADSIEDEEVLSEYAAGEKTPITIEDLKNGRIKVKSRLWELLEDFFYHMSGG